MTNGEQLKLKPREVSIMGRRQRIYVKECVPAYSTHIPQQQKEYVLERVDLPNGYQYELVERDYPINSESVSSYADTADYRNDPLGAVAKQPTRINLGDITGVQDFIGSDPQKAVTVYKEVLKNISAYLEAVSKKEPADNGADGADEPAKENKE